MCVFGQRVWDELDRWHSRVAALEVEVHDIADDHPEEAHVLTDKLMETLQLYQHVAKQAEQRTAFLSKVSWTTFPRMPNSTRNLTAALLVAIFIYLLYLL